MWLVGLSRSFQAGTMDHGCLSSPSSVLHHLPVDGYSGKQCAPSAKKLQEFGCVNQSIGCNLQNQPGIQTALTPSPFLVL